MPLFDHVRLRYWVLLLAVALRLALALVNTDANDNHLAVVSFIANENRIPALPEAFQAYHAKLYHVTIALLWKLSPTDSPYVLIRIAQLFNTFLGVWTLVAIRRWLQEMPISEPVRTIVFALAALNPGLIAIHSQATNDTLVIWLSTLALIAAGRYLVEPSPRGFVRVLIPCLLAPLAKANGFLTVFSIVGAFALMALYRRADRPPRTAGLALVLLLASVGAAFTLGPYGRHWRVYGDPFILNIPKNPVPDWWAETEFGRPGARSIVGALGTFHFVDLMRRPMVARPIQRPDAQVELHRTSLWTQLFARSHFAHYHNHPETWTTSGPAIEWLGRMLYLFGLPWSLLLTAGMVWQGWRTAWLRDPKYAPALIAAWMQIAFVMQFCLVYRDMSSMKVIYILPGLAGYAWALASAAEALWRRGWRTSMTAGAVILAGLYVVDAAWLSGHLIADKLPLLWKLVAPAG